MSQNIIKIIVGLNMNTNLINTKSGSLWWCVLVLSNTWATFEAQFLNGLKNTEVELKKSVYYKKERVYIPYNNL